MKSAALIIATLATAMASPLAVRANQCNVAPAGPSSGNIKPIATPSAATARDCQAACNTNKSCKSFVFGLPSSASSPQCLLFAVPASQVPPQHYGELFVFDKGCASTVIPSTAPTHSSPRGNVKKLAVRAEAVCNVAPTGTQSSAAPLSSPDCSTSRECQTACAENSKCQCFAFGLPSGATKPTCQLFEVPAAQVPALAANMNVFDKACEESKVPNTTPTRDAPQGKVSDVSAPKATNNSAPKATKVSAPKATPTPAKAGSDNKQTESENKQTDSETKQSGGNVQGSSQKNSENDSSSTGCKA